ncbi:MAG: MerR family transcriptional regulator [Chitinophagaceae bacterium]|nr:MerR family transcriptional regulator [Chitinophagaceae bacterium]MCW5905814.1 MerR family transcriptional regulator [Chitinophagaceae bacterium]
MDAELGSVNIPDDETLKKKLYYPISEVAVFFNVNTSLIRMWETEFDILQPRKNKKGDRLFRFEDIKNLQIIYYLLRNRKFSLDGAKKYLKENKGTLDSEQQLVQSLKKIRKFLIDIKTDLQA